MSGWGRRAVAAGVGGLLLALALAAAGVLTAAGERFRARVDVTTTGEQRLAPRTMAILDQAALLGEVEIVVAVDASTLEPWSRRTVRDVLDLFEHAGGVRASEVDVGSAAGQTEYAALIERLVERERAGIDEHVGALRGAAASAAEGAARLEQQAAPSLLAVRDMLGEGEEGARNVLEQWASVMRLGSRRLAEAADAAAAAMSEPETTMPIPPLAEHEAALRRVIDDRAGELESLAEEIERLGGAETGPAGLKSACDSILQGVREIRDGLARASDSLARLPALDILRVARALGTAEVALVIGPAGTGVVGIDISTLYEPRVVATDGSRLTGDVRFQAEELFASAISSVLSSARPIVVLTHGEVASVLDGAALFGGIGERLAQRGIDLIEWRAFREEEAPGLADLNPAGLRPVVYAILAPDSTAAARSAEDAPGPERAAALGRVIERLVGERAAILMSFNPSVLPAYGEQDPLAAPFAGLGLDVLSGQPLLREIVSTRARDVLPEISLTAQDSEGPILAAARNLPTLLAWSIPIRWSDGELRVTPLLVAPDDGATWAESQWVRLWQTPWAQRPLLPDKPRFDDGVDGGEGPWVVAVAAERADAPAGSRAGRIVVVGSNGWFSDRAAFKYQTTDGRVSLAHPGNAELFEAAVLWLAGQDELIAQSAGARAVALVGPIEPATLSAVRWGLIAGLPVLTLVVGVAWRLVRG